MLHYLQIWLKKDRIDSFKNMSKETGRTQVEIFERMTESYKETEEYAMLVKLNTKQKKRNALIALALIGTAMLSWSSLMQRQPMDWAGIQSPWEPTYWK